MTFSSGDNRKTIRQAIMSTVWSFHVLCLIGVIDYRSKHKFATKPEYILGILFIVASAHYSFHLLLLLTLGDECFLHLRNKWQGSVPEGEIGVAVAEKTVWEFDEYKLKG